MNIEKCKQSIIVTKLNDNGVTDFDSFRMQLTHHYGHWEKTSHFTTKGSTVHTTIDDVVHREEQ